MKGEFAKVLLERYDILLKDLCTEPVTSLWMFFINLYGSSEYFLAIQHNFDKDEGETTAQATEKRKKPEKTPVGSKD